MEIVKDQPNRVTRGGMYSSGPRDVRSAARATDAPSAENIYVGFRLVRTIEAQALIGRGRIAGAAIWHWLVSASTRA